MKKIFSIITYVCVVLFLASIFLLIRKNILYKRTVVEIESSKINVIPSERSIKSRIDELIDEYDNKDIIGILNIKDVINVPITQAKDNEYYLRHSLARDKSIIGSPFLDYRQGKNDRQLNIYGHNSTRYNPPFKSLEGYLEKDFYDKNKYIEFYINDEKRTYEIFSVLLAERKGKEEHFQFTYKTNESWLEHFERFKKRSIYDTGVSLNEKDNIIVLQTCLFGKHKNKFLVVVGKSI